VGLFQNTCRVPIGSKFGPKKLKWIYITAPSNSPFRDSLSLLTDSLLSYNPSKPSKPHSEFIVNITITFSLILTFPFFLSLKPKIHRERKNKNTVKFGIPHRERERYGEEV